MSCRCHCQRDLSVEEIAETCEALIEISDEWMTLCELLGEHVSQLIEVVRRGETPAADALAVIEAAFTAAQEQAAEDRFAWAAIRSQVYGIPDVPLVH
jgi:hypothetical protein